MVVVVVLFPLTTCFRCCVAFHQGTVCDAAQPRVTRDIR